MPGYGLQACPALYPGQLVEADIEADAAALPHALTVAPLRQGLRPRRRARALSRARDGPRARRAAPSRLARPRHGRLAGLRGRRRGLRRQGRDRGALYLDRLWWSGEPDTVLGPQADGGTAWRRAWVDATSSFVAGRKEPLRIAQNRGTGLLIQGGRDWKDIEASAELTAYMARSHGLAVRVQGLRRYAALLLCDDGKARLVRVFDRERKVLAETPFACDPGSTHTLRLRARGSALSATIDGKLVLEAPAGAPDDGAVALVCEEGTIGTDRVVVRPAGR